MNISTSNEHGISIIIPCYNYGNYLREALDSVLIQCWKKIECVIIDDGSIDNTKNIAKSYCIKYPNVFFYYFQNNSGASIARNYGLSKASFNHILFMDADDLLEANALLNLIKAMYGSNSDCVWGQWTDFTDENIIGRSSKILCKKHNDAIAIMIDQRPVISSFLIKKEFLSDFDSTLMVWESLCVFINAVYKGAKVSFTNNLVTRIRQHSSENRLTIKYNHFEPYATGLFFSQVKKKLIASEKINFYRIEVLDRIILGNAQMLQRTKKSNEAKKLLLDIDRKLMPEYSWFKIFGSSGAYYCCGFLGWKIFHSFDHYRMI